MSGARNRARLLHWNVDPTPPKQRDQAGEVIAAEIRIWNRQAAIDAERWRKLGRELGLTKGGK